MRARAQAPLAVQVQPFDTIERRGPVSPRQLGFRRIAVSDDAESAEACDVFHDITWLSGNRVRRRRHPRDRVVAAGLY